MAADGTIYAIDPYVPGRLGFSAPRLIALTEVSKIRNGNVLWVRSTGVAAASDLKKRIGSVDFVFIDGDHSFEGLRGDWEAWNPLITKWGIVALHDSCSSSERQIENAGSVRYTTQAILPDTRFRVLERVDTLTVLQRLTDE
jgi:hypothetical protein